MVGSLVPFQVSTFLCLGEGQTEGNETPQFSWPTQLSGMGNMPNYKVTNLAVPNYRANDVARTLYTTGKPYWPTVTRIPSIVWVHAGPPDMENFDTGAHAYSLIAPMLSDATAAGFKVGVTKCWYNPDFPQSVTDEFMAYNSLVAADPSVTPGLVFDGAATFPNPGTLPYFESAYHLNQAGYAIYAAAVYNLLKAALLV